MRTVIQRVLHASVTVEGAVVGQVGPGMLILFGAMVGDREEDAARLADRITTFRIFREGERSMERSALDLVRSGTSVGVLVVSQFTLAADGRKGRRPSFDRAAPPAEATALYEAFIARLRAAGLPVATGRFGAMMEVALVNDGPVTFVLDEPRDVSHRVDNA